MYFKLRYFRNPLARAWPKQSGQGEYLLNKGLHNISMKVMYPKRHINPTLNAKRAIHGLACLYGFRYRSFMTDNFIAKRKYLYYHGIRCTLSKWALMIGYLNQEVTAIFGYQNLSTLLRSRYAKYIQIAHIDKYYHPRKRHYVSNARTALAELGNNHRYNFTGVFQRFGGKSNGQLTILLTDISYQGHRLTDHLWFNATKQFRNLGHLTNGEQLAFRARVKRYRKGYLPKDFIHEYDYKLSYPSHVRKLT